MVTTTVPTFRLINQTKTPHTQPYATRSMANGTSLLVEIILHVILAKSENQLWADTHSLALTNPIKVAFSEKLRTSLIIVEW